VSYVELLTLTLWQLEQALSKFFEGDQGGGQR
jgi:hypothetical protein